MKDGANVIRAFAIGLAALLVCSTTSSACPLPPPGYWKSLNLYKSLTASYTNTEGYVNPSPSSENMESYLRTSPLEELIDAAEVIFIGTPKFYPAGVIPSDPDRNYVTAKFNVKENLKGRKASKYAYATPEDGIIPILSIRYASKEIKDNFATFQKEEKRKVEKHKDFTFWDFSRLSNLRTNDEMSRGTSCGPFSIPMLSKKQSYIVIATQNTVIVEPVANEDDSLVIAIKARLKEPLTRMGPTISANDFMQGMERVKVLKTEICQADKIVGRLKIEKVLNGQAKDQLYQTTYAEMLNEYFSQTRKGHDCKLEQKYLMYGHDDIPQDISTSWDEQTLGFRFARIKDGDILVSDIATHLIFTDEILSINNLDQHTP